MFCSIWNSFHPFLWGSAFTHLFYLSKYTSYKKCQFHGIKNYHSTYFKHSNQHFFSRSNLYYTCCQLSSYYNMMSGKKRWLSLSQFLSIVLCRTNSLTAVSTVAYLAIHHTKVMRVGSDTFGDPLIQKVLERWAILPNLDALSSFAALSKSAKSPLKISDFLRLKIRV